MHTHSASVTPKFSVAICGGGVGGLVLAVALARYPDIRVDVYEAAAQFAEVGVGVGMFPRAWRVMQALGLADDLAQVTNSTPEERERTCFTFRKADEPEGYDFYNLTTPGGLIAFHRPDFQAVLLRHVPPRVGLHTAKQLVSYASAPSSPAAPLALHFADGSSAHADVLVGADGIKSGVRREMFEQLARGADAEHAAQMRACKEPRWSGMWAYRAVVPMGQLRARLPDHRVTREPMIYMGEDSQFTIYPVAREAQLNFAAFRGRPELAGAPLPPQRGAPASPAELHAEFAHLEPELHALFDVIERPLKWAVHTVEPLPTFVDGRAALLGDAAHAMLPFQGAGAGQAIEDAFLLAALLGHPACARGALPRALAAYDAARRPAAQRVARLSADAARLYMLRYPGMDARWAAGAPGRLPLLAEKVRENWEWAWASSVDGEVRDAVRRFEEDVREEDGGAAAGLPGAGGEAIGVH